MKVVASLNASGQIQLTATSNVTITSGAWSTGAGGGTLSGIVGLTGRRHGAGRQLDAAAEPCCAIRLASRADRSGRRRRELQRHQSARRRLAPSNLNETGTSSLTVTGGSLTSSGLGLSASSNSWQLDSDINSALTKINAAIATVSATSASLGSSGTILQTRLDFNKSMVDTLNGGASDLTANDSNADSALLLALQTRQQLATTTLSLANGAYASALQLFG